MIMKRYLLPSSQAIWPAGSINRRWLSNKTPSKDLPKLTRSESFKIGSDFDDVSKPLSSKSPSASSDNPISNSSSSNKNADGDDSQRERLTVVITGAAGNLGMKAATHLLQSNKQKYNLVLMDHSSCPDEYKKADSKNGHRLEYVQCDFSKYDRSWVQKINSPYACFLFAARHPQPDASSIDAFQSMMMNSNLLEACAAAKANRVVFASSNHVMGGMLHEKGQIAANARPKIGTKYTIPEATMDSTLYSSAKIATEAQMEAMTTSGRLARGVILRIGFCQPGKNEKSKLNTKTGNPSKKPREPASGGDPKQEKLVENWWKGMYLSNEDFVKLIDRCVAPDLDKNEKKLMYANGVSANEGSRWGKENDICFQPSAA